MRLSEGKRVVNALLGVATPLMFAAGLLVAAGIIVLAFFPAAVHDGSWLLGYGAATTLALALPVAFVACYERWQVRHGLYRAVPDARAKVLDAACGAFGVVLLLTALPVLLLCAYFGWIFWSDGMVGSSAYFAVVALLVLAEPLAFLHYHDRWERRNCLG